MLWQQHYIRLEEAKNKGKVIIVLSVTGGETTVQFTFNRP
jgi:hypothetical protein